MLKFITSLHLLLLAAPSLADTNMRVFYESLLTIKSSHTIVGSGTKTVNEMTGTLTWSDDQAFCEMVLRRSEIETVVLPCTPYFSGLFYFQFESDESREQLFSSVLNIGQFEVKEADVFVPRLIGYRTTKGSQMTYQVHTSNIRESYHVSIMMARPSKL